MRYDEYDWPLKNPDHRPFVSQRKTTEFLLYNPRAYVLSEMRTGKTLAALWATDLLFHNNKINRVLIVTTLSTVRIVWAAHIFENFPHRSYIIAHGNADTRFAALRSNANYIIINHDGIKSVEKEIIKKKFDIILIDEMTAFKNPSSDRSKCMKRIADSVHAVWGMTGNPTPNSPVEAFGQAKVVNPSNPYLPRYYGQFKNMVETPIFQYQTVPKPDAKNTVFKVLQPSIRFEREQCFDIPPMIHKSVEIEMSTQQKQVYKKIRDELYHEYEAGEITAVNAAVKLIKLLQISAGAVKNDVGEILYLDDTPKMNYIYDLFEEMGREKMMVVSAFRATVERVCSLLKKKKIQCEYIHGGISLNKRTELMTEFQTGRLKILVVQPEAVSRGTCFDATNIIVWHSLVASGEVYSQMKDRIISASQTKKQYNEYLLGSKADKHILDILTRKANFSHEVLHLLADKEL